MEKIARSTLDYVLQDLTSPQGGFYSTRDADSEGEEGTYYVWTPKQLVALLGEMGGQFLTKTLGTVADGEFSGKIVVHRDIDLTGNELAHFDKLLKQLLQVRGKRTAPHLDKKIITS